MAPPASGGGPGGVVIARARRAEPPPVVVAIPENIPQNAQGLAQLAALAGQQARNLLEDLRRQIDSGEGVFATLDGGSETPVRMHEEARARFNEISARYMALYDTLRQPPPRRIAYSQEDRTYLEQTTLTFINTSQYDRYPPDDPDATNGLVAQIQEQGFFGRLSNHRLQGIYLMEAVRESALGANNSHIASRG